MVWRWSTTLQPLMQKLAAQTVYLEHKSGLEERFQEATQAGRVASESRR